jgi:transposase
MLEYSMTAKWLELLKEIAPSITRAAVLRDPTVAGGVGQFGAIATAAPTVTTIGLDIAKSVFQVHGVDAADQVVIRRQLKRRAVLAFFQKLSPCLVGIEACASSHYWSRELQALGHTVRLMPPAYVKPYVKRQKNDMADAEAICEAVTRANMRFVPTKTPEQQSCLMLHRTRHLFIRQQTAVINSIRAHLAELGIVAPVGRKGVTELLHVVADPSDKRRRLPARALPRSALNCSASRSILGSSTG